MSRGFVKEGDQEEVPIIPPRAPIPVQETNYVTPHGMALLNEEKSELELQRTKLIKAANDENRIAITVLTRKLEMLQERIASARILDPKEQPQNEVRFGATVTYRMLKGNITNTLKIVGVDEADVKQGKIAFIAPIAVALSGSHLGDVIDFRLGDELKKIEVLKISY